MGRPKATDPKIRFSLSLRRSVLDRIADKAEQQGETVGEWIERVVVAQRGIVDPKLPDAVEVLIERPTKARPMTVGRERGHAPTCSCPFCKTPSKPTTR